VPILHLPKLSGIKPSHLLRPFDSDEIVNSDEAMDTDEMSLDENKTKKDICPICLDTLEDNSGVLLPCMHAFDTACIEKSIEKSSKCPLCRGYIHSYKNNNNEIIPVLSEEFLEVNRAIREGISIYHILRDAINKNNPDLILHLLQRGANINHVYQSERDIEATPLSIAVKNNNAPMVKFLIEHGAHTEQIFIVIMEPNFDNSHILTPDHGTILYAMTYPKYYNQEIAHLLIRLGANTDYVLKRIEEHREDHSRNPNYYSVKTENALYDLIMKLKPTCSIM
jgi:hypothetical protein